MKKNLSKAIKPKKFNLNKSSGKNIPELWRKQSSTDRHFSSGSFMRAHVERWFFPNAPGIASQASVHPHPSCDLGIGWTATQPKSSTYLLLLLSSSRPELKWWREWWQSTPAQNGDGYGTPLQQTMVMGMALQSSKQWLWVAMECVKQLLWSKELSLQGSMLKMERGGNVCYQSLRISKE